MKRKLLMVTSSPVFKANWSVIRSMSAKLGVPATEKSEKRTVLVSPAFKEPKPAANLLPMLLV